MRSVGDENNSQCSLEPQTRLTRPHYCLNTTVDAELVEYH